MTKQRIAIRSRKKPSKIKSPAVEQTFMDHVKELQSRLFFVAIAFIVVAGAAYPFFDKIVNVILAPLGENHELVYLTPGGAFGFIIQVCMYVGLIGALPVMVYHLYKFLTPAVKAVNTRRVVGYTIASFLLALIGIAFAYFISLPAALYFLTGFDLYHINPMLTIDSYFGFVMAYMIAGALLFQLPLVMMIVDSIKPQSPKSLMKYQQHIIVGSFVVAAIISPTPDALNQALLALPIILMYQIGIVIIWFKHRKDRKKAKQIIDAKSEVVEEVTPVVVAQQPAPIKEMSFSAAQPGTVNKLSSPGSYRVGTSMDGFVVSSPKSRTFPVVPARVNLRQTIPARPEVSVGPSRPVTRSLDGFII